MSHLPLLLLLLLVVNIDSVRGTEPKSREQLTIELEKLSKKVEQLEARENEAEKLGEKIGEKLNEGLQKLGDMLQEGITKLGEKQTEGMEKLGQALAESQACGTGKKETTPTAQEPQCQPVTCPPSEDPSCDSDRNAARVGFFAYLRRLPANNRTVQDSDNVLQGSKSSFLINQGSGFDRRTGVFTAPVNGTYLFFTTAVTVGTNRPFLVAPSGGSMGQHYYVPESGNLSTSLMVGRQNLTAGARVWARSSGAGELYPMATTFGGFLIHEN